MDAELGVVPLAPPAVLVFGTVGDEEEEASRGETDHEAVQEGLRLRVDPLEVFEYKEQRASRTFSKHKPLHAVEDTLAAFLRVEGLPGFVRDCRIEECEERGQGRQQCGIERLELTSNALVDRPRALAVLYSEVRPEEFGDGEVGRGLPVGHGTRRHDPPLFARERVGKFPYESRFADTGIADDGHDLPVTGRGLIAKPSKLHELGVTTDETRQPAPRPRLETGSGHAGAGYLVDLDRFREPFHRHEPQGFHLDVALDEGPSCRGDDDGSGIGELLHPPGQVRRLADRGVVHAEITADSAHNHLARVQSHANPDDRRMRTLRLSGIFRHALLHPERGIASPHRMVFVGEGSAEEGHDAVTHHLIDGSLVAMNGLHQPFEDGIENLASLLRVAIGEELHRALEVGEEHGDLLALALEPTLREEDLLREMLGRIGLGRREGGAHGLPQRCATLTTELLPRGNRFAAGGTRYGERNSALPAEPLIRGVFGPSTGTRHVGASETLGTVSRGHMVAARRLKDTAGPPSLETGPRLWHRHSGRTRRFGRSSEAGSITQGPVSSPRIP